jgi:hypothetical protein
MRGIDLENHDALQQTEWRTQRVCWFLWSAIIVAAGLGLLGPGPLSAARNSNADGALTVTYDRFLHYHHPTELRITIGGATGVGDEVKLKLNQALLNRIRIQRIEPEPVRASLAGDGIVYAFSASDSTDLREIVFHVDFERIGRSRGTIAVNGKAPIVVSQFVYP